MDGSAADAYMITKQLVRNYSMQHYCHRVLATDVPVLRLKKQ